MLPHDLIPLFVLPRSTSDWDEFRWLPAQKPRRWILRDERLSVLWSAH